MSVGQPGEAAPFHVFDRYEASTVPVIVFLRRIRMLRFVSAAPSTGPFRYHHGAHLRAPYFDGFGPLKGPLKLRKKGP